MTNTKVLWITIWLANLIDIKERLSVAGFLFKKNNDYVTFCKIDFNKKRAPEVTECIIINKELHVKLFFKDCLVPLPQWFPKTLIVV